MKQNPPLVLLAAPVSRQKAYVLPEWLQHIRRLSYPNYHIYLVDNSADRSHQRELWEQGYRCGYVCPEGKRAPAFVAESQNELRRYFLAGGYDYFFSLECDNFPPPNIIEWMLSYGLDNFNIPYFLKQNQQTTLSVQRSVINYQGWCANKVLAPMDSIGQFDGRVKHYFAPSLGCSLFSRRLMERIQFRVDDTNPYAFSDSFFHWDSNRLGIKPWVHMGTLCEHRRFTWKFNGDLKTRLPASRLKIGVPAHLTSP